MGRWQGDRHSERKGAVTIQEGVRGTLRPGVALGKAGDTFKTQAQGDFPGGPVVKTLHFQCRE